MRREVLEWAQKITLACIVVIALAVVYLSARALGFRSSPAAALDPASPTPTTDSAPPTAPVQITDTPQPSPTPTAPRPTATSKGPHPIHIGIVAGHYMNDSGAICPDGLREADINLAVTERVTARLKRRGYVVDLLAEFDDKLQGYQADVFLSLHSDSCDVVGMSGFKIARSQNSAIPTIEDKLVECLSTHFSESTGLSFQANTITPSMRDYHAFREIASDTPAAIIELGFMSDDRNVLLYKQDRLAKGIVDGIQCFLDGR